jgi:DNA invertase Pin-like site-specific DNA recombinase
MTGVVVTELSRLARSMTDLVAITSKLKAKEGLEVLQ